MSVTHSCKVSNVSESSCMTESSMAHHRIYENTQLYEHTNMVDGESDCTSLKKGMNKFFSVVPLPSPKGRSCAK